MSEKDPHTLFIQAEESAKRYRLFLDDIIHEGSAFHEILNTLHNANQADTLETRINSSGGYVRYGQQYINVMKDKFAGRSVTILEAECSSMASLVFMAGDERVIYPHAIMMVHEPSMYLGGKSSESKAQLEIYIPASIKYFSSIMGDTMTEDEMDGVFEGQDFWFDAEDMCRRGIATKVIFEGEAIEARDYLRHICPDEAYTEEELSTEYDEIQEQLEAIMGATKALKAQKKFLKARKGEIDESSDS